MAAGDRHEKGFGESMSSISEDNMFWPMRRFIPANLAWLVLLGLSLLPSAVPAGSVNPYRGLWVGEVTVNYVTEVTTPLDENNVPIAPDPKIPTPTADKANLRLILHVDGSGHVSLLKNVAILNRVGGTNGLTADSDVALVTDASLYGQFPPQPAIRIASAAFDFGDNKTTAAVNAII